MLLTLVTGILLTLLIGSILYAAIWLFPQKIKLIHKYGKDKTNDDLIALAKNGNSDVQKLLKKSRVTLGVAITSGVLLTLINHFIRR